MNRNQLHEIIFEADTKIGKAFDILLFWAICLSVLVVMLDSVSSFHDQYQTLLISLEWFFTILFTLEYILRLQAVKHPVKYAKSFFGIIDLLAILPTYLSLLFPGTQYLLVIRLLRILRIFRVFKLVKYLNEAQNLLTALRNSRRKIVVFLFTVLTIVIIFGSIMYVIEGDGDGGFTSIPKSIYWAIVTLTTVGYGDISPQTNLGQTLAAMIMILGYAIIAVPTGIVTAEMVSTVAKNEQKISTQACPSCSAEGHAFDAKFCKYCGAKL